MIRIQEEQNLFMASISHELRTPLTSILGYGELLENTHLDSQQQEYLNRMLHSSKYLLSLVGDFLDIIKLKNNDMCLDPKEVRLHTVLMECADVIKAKMLLSTGFGCAIDNANAFATIINVNNTHIIFFIFMVIHLVQFQLIFWHLKTQS